MKSKSWINFGIVFLFIYLQLKFIRVFRDICNLFSVEIPQTLIYHTHWRLRTYIHGTERRIFTMALNWVNVEFLYATSISKYKQWQPNESEDESHHRIDCFRVS